MTYMERLFFKLKVLQEGDEHGKHGGEKKDKIEESIWPCIKTKSKRIYIISTT